MHGNLAAVHPELARRPRPPAAAPAVSLVELSSDGGVSTLTLNRPQALNALDRALTEALEEALTRLAQLDEARVVLVTGRGRAFCAGNDLREMEALGEEAHTLPRRHAALLERFAQLPQVTIAVIDGYALGGGLMLAVAQDLRVASDRARLGLPEVTLGFNPAYGIARLLDVAGGGYARDLLLSGRTIRAQEALRMGLVNRVVAAPTLAGRARAWAHELAAWPREGLAATKRVLAELRAGRPGGEAEAFAAALASPAARQRVRAFVASRHRAH